MTEDEIVSAYLDSRQGSERNTDAWDAVNDAIANDPALAVRLIERLLVRGRTESELALIGAGPLESFLVERGEEYLADLTRIATLHTKKFFLAYRVVYFNDVAPTVFSSLDDALERGGIPADRLRRA